MPMIVRRVVTGHTEQGKAAIVMDAPAPNVVVLPGSGGLRITELWETAGSPADISGNKDAADRKIRLEPPTRGSIFRVIEFPPDAEREKSIDRAQMFSAMGAGHARSGDASHHPGMHKTGTIDYAVVISGEIYAILEEGEVLLKQGDCLVQRATNHAWSNRSDKPCQVAFVLVSANPG